MEFIKPKSITTLAQLKSRREELRQKEAFVTRQLGAQMKDLRKESADNFLNKIVLPGGIGGLLIWGMKQFFSQDDEESARNYDHSRRALHATNKNRWSQVNPLLKLASQLYLRSRKR